LLLHTQCSSKKHAQKDEIVVPQGMFDLQFGDLFLKGCEQRMKGNLNEALKYFEECQRYDPNQPALQYELAMVHQLLGHHKEALVYAKKAAAADDNNEWYQHLLATCYTQNGQHAQATKVMETLVQKYPARADLKEDLAYQYLSTKQKEKALNVYKLLEAEFGPKESIVLSQVNILNDLKRYNEAEAALLALIKSNPNENQYLLYLAEYYKGIEQHKKAIAAYEELLKRDPEQVQALLALSDYYMANGQSALAETYLERTLRNKNLDEKIAMHILSVYVNQAREGQKSALQTGLKLALAYTENHPQSAVGYGYLGDFYKFSGKETEAADAYTRASFYETRNYQLWENLLYADNATNRVDSLIVHGIRATELFPTHALFYLYLGSGLVQKKRFKEAEEYLVTGKAYVTSNNKVMLEFLSVLGDVYYYNKSYEASDRAFDEALKIDPDNTHVLNNYAYYLSLRGEKLELAEKLSYHCLQLAPNETNFMDTYAWVLYKQGKYADAESWIAKAAAKRPSAAVLEHWGDILYKLNKKEAAVSKWKQAREAGNLSELLNTKINEQKLSE